MGIGKTIKDYQVLIGITAFIIALVAGGYIASTITPGEDGVPAGEFVVTQLWKFHCVDLLDEGSNAGSGTLAIYDPDDPGTPIESSLSLTSGYFTTGQTYTSGEVIFLKYTDSAYFDYGVLITIPKWTQDFDTIVTSGLNYPDSLEVIKMADMLQGASNTDVDGLKNGASAWDDSSGVVDGFNRTTDGDYPKMGIMVTNEDTETAYVDPRGYYDYSADVAEQRDRKSYLMVEFALVSGSAITDVNDYLVFQTWPSGMTKKKMGTSMVVFYPLNDMDSAILYDIDTDNNPIGQKDGNAIIFELTFDFSGTIAGALDGDDIDIEISVASGFPMDWFENHLRLTSIPGDDSLGEVNVSWTNDWSIGW